MRAKASWAGGNGGLAEAAVGIEHGKLALEGIRKRVKRWTRKKRKSRPRLMRSKTACSAGEEGDGRVPEERLHGDPFQANGPNTQVPS